MKKLIIDGVETVLTHEYVEVDGRDINEETKCGICYTEIEEGDSAMIANHINPENEQKICTNLCHVDCLDDDATEQALTVTSRYHDWSDTIADQFVDSVDEDTTETEFNALVKKFKKEAKGLNHSCLSVTDMVEEIIDDTRSDEFAEEEEDED
jgi:hypothetical protein